MLALGATIVTNKRKIAADEFFTGLFETALKDGEIVTAVELHRAGQGRLREVPQPGLALRHDRRVRGEDTGGDVRVAVTGAAKAASPGRARSRRH